MIVPPISNVLLSSWGSPHEHEMRRSRSGPLHPWSARSRFVEHSNPAHANPTAQILAARRDDRPATRRRTTGRKHRFIDRIRAPHNRYIATPINARNVCDRKSLTGATRRCGDYNGSSIAGARERRRTCAAYGTAADQRLRTPKKRAARTAHSQTPIPYTTIQRLYLFFICSCYPIFIQNWVLVCAVRARA